MKRYKGLASASKKLPRRKNAHPEHDAQCTVIAWAKALEGRCPDLALLFAVPNGMRTSMRTAIKAKREGLKAGVPDLWLPVPRERFALGDGDCYAGLVIEMKAPTGKVSVEQSKWLFNLRDRGWRCEVCYSAGEAVTVLCDYLGLPLSLAEGIN